MWILCVRKSTPNVANGVLKSSNFGSPDTISRNRSATSDLRYLANGLCHRLNPGSHDLPSPNDDNSSPMAARLKPSSPTLEHRIAPIKEPVEEPDTLANSKPFLTNSSTAPA